MAILQKCNYFIFRKEDKMKNVKRALAMCLTLVLLLSCSPVFNVSATGTESESDAPSAYKQLMDHYDLAIFDNSSDSKNTVWTSKSGFCNNISRVEDSTGNVYWKFDKTPNGQYINANIKYQGTDSSAVTDCTKIIFEVDIRWDNPGLSIFLNARTQNKNLVYLQNGTLTIKSPDGDKVVYLNAGEWHRITYVIDFDNSVFSAFVNEEQVVDNKRVVSGFSSIAAIRFQTQALGTGADTSKTPDFYIDNVKWHVYRECTDTNNDGYCDYSGCGKRTQYAVNESGKIVNANGEVLTEITASGVLNLNGKNATVKVAEGTTLAVVDTSWMTNGLSDEKVGKLTIDPESKGTVESYTQYGDFKYLKVPGEDGTYTFHPFNLTITRMGLNTVMEAISLEVQFVADNVVRDLLRENDHNYGLKNGNGVEISVKENSAYQFTAQNNRAVAYFATDSLHNDNFDTERTFQAYMKLKVGNEEVEILSNYKAVISPRKIMTDLNNSNVQPSGEQLVRIQEMLAKPEYSELANVLTRFK